MVHDVRAALLSQRVNYRCLGVCCANRVEWAFARTLRIVSKHDASNDAEQTTRRLYLFRRLLRHNLQLSRRRNSEKSQNRSFFQVIETQNKQRRICNKLIVENKKTTLELETLISTAPTKEHANLSSLVRTSST